jgi:D-alanyl-lipoteichoic acid acyltransferase DltB (MBOAT superfamily)
MSYTIEVYRGHQKAERHLGYYALYVMYYPQLVAGPIERPQNVLHQFRTEHRFDYNRAVDGLKLMAYGLFKKVVIADNLAAYVDQYYGHLNDQSYNSLVAMLFFSIQIYCDFSGYSDIALGASKVMGIELMKNFSYPYFSHSITEFWRKWHISLSTWFRDYLYIPLGGNRQHKYRNVFIVFMVSGLWHGANWTFVIWGAIHGAFQIVEDKLGLKQNRGLLALLYANIVVMLAWVFFRAADVPTALHVIANAVTPRFDLHNPLLSKKILLVTALFMGWEYLISRNGFLPVLNALRPTFRYSVYYLMVVAILFLGRFGTAQFIYFQF